MNLIIVFFITGLWHGASWNFVIWGLFHGFFLLLERNVTFSIPKKFFFLKRVYLLMVVIISWVFFRIEDLGEALNFLFKMFSFTNGKDSSPLMYLDSYIWIVIILGVIFSTPIRKLLSIKIDQIFGYSLSSKIIEPVFYIVLFIFTIMELAQTTYNPFIYFRF